MAGLREQVAIAGTDHDVTSSRATSAPPSSHDFGWLWRAKSTPTRDSNMLATEVRERPISGPHCPYEG